MDSILNWNDHRVGGGGGSEYQWIRRGGGVNINGTSWGGSEYQSIHYIIFSKVFCLSFC